MPRARRAGTIESFSWIEARNDGRAPNRSVPPRIAAMSDRPTDVPARARRDRAQRAWAEFEDEATAVRRHFRAALPAVRLLIGAYAFREVGEDEYEAALASLIATENELAGGAIELDVPAHRDRLAACRDRLSLPCYHARLREFIGDRGVLVVSDAGWRGWAELFKALFGTDNPPVDWDSAEYIYRDPDDLAIVFHDLSPHSEQGTPAEIVERVKSAHFDLPVVVFSERDDVREMARCLRAGAAGYFCYEPGNDRESIATFEQFAGLVREAIPPESWRKLWKKLREFTGPVPDSHGSRLYRRVVHHLRRAYWFLTMDAKDPRARLLLGTDGRADAAASLEEAVERVRGHAYRLVAISCGAAVERALSQAYTDLHRRLGVSKQIIQRLDRSVPKMLDALFAADEIDEAQYHKFLAIWRQRNPVIHEDMNLGEREAEDTLSETIELLREFFVRFDAPAE